MLSPTYRPPPPRLLLLPAPHEVPPAQHHDGSLPQRDLVPPVPGPQAEVEHAVLGGCAAASRGWGGAPGAPGRAAGCVGQARRSLRRCKAPAVRGRSSSVLQGPVALPTLSLPTGLLGFADRDARAWPLARCILPAPTVPVACIPHVPSAHPPRDCDGPPPAAVRHLVVLCAHRPPRLLHQQRLKGGTIVRFIAEHQRNLGMTGLRKGQGARPSNIGGAVAEECASGCGWAPVIEP